MEVSERRAGDRRGRPRVRIRYEGGKWYAVLVDREDKELDRSPGGTEVDAEIHMKNYKRFGAWQKS